MAPQPAAATFGASPAPRSARLREMVLFGLVGVLNTGVDIAVFAALIGLTAMPVMLANVVSYSAGALNSYFMNGRVTYRSRKVRLASWRRVGRFALVNLACLLVSLVALAALMMVLPPIVAKLGSVVATFAFGYVLSSLVVYTDKPEG
jgi:putative flippase GtrA